MKKKSDFKNLNQSYEYPSKNAFLPNKYNFLFTQMYLFIE
jgi:hypothetical protein